MNDETTDADRDRTIADFGEQWTEFTDNEGYYASADLLADLTGPLCDPAEFSGAKVADIGSGTGRIVRMLAGAGAAKIVAVEPSAAMDVLQANTSDLRDRIEYLRARGDELPASGDLDFVVSMGVLHHIPDPAPVVRAAYAALRPGGKIVVWLYGHEGNALYLALTVPLRRLTRRMPHRALHALSRVLEPPLSAYAAACRVAPLPMAAYMREHIAKLSRDVRVLTIYDQLNPQYAKYYRRAEALDLLRDAGFSDVVAHHRHGYSWTVMGTKPAAPDANTEAR